MIRDNDKRYYSELKFTFEKDLSKENQTIAYN